jgi:hypothetical protein
MAHKIDLIFQAKDFWPPSLDKNSDWKEGLMLLEKVALSRFPFAFVDSPMIQFFFVSKH